MIPELVAQHLAQQAQAAPWAGKGAFAVEAYKPLGGGSVNNVFRLETNWGDYCLKYNHSPTAGPMFASEALQLAQLRRLATLAVPQPLLHGTAGYASYLLMEYIRTGAKHRQFWEKFGRGLARMHKVEGPAFGGMPDNFIGTLPQSNACADSWQMFFASQRLLPMARMAYDYKVLTDKEVQQVSAICTRLNELCPTEPPALVHGDLWKGNYLTGPDGLPVLIDPALHFGHREADLAMTLLFGGFDAPFYEAYQDEFPLAGGFAERFQVYNLYPLLVHLVLFGEGYHFAVSSILGQFGS